MNRRKLILTFIAVAAVSVLPNTQLFRSSVGEVAPISRERKKKRVKELKSGDAYTTESDTIIHLPFRPNDQDYVKILVQQESTIEFFENRILGRSEPLRLDTLAIIKLTFHSATNNWRLG